MDVSNFFCTLPQWIRSNSGHRRRPVVRLGQYFEDLETRVVPASVNVIPVDGTATTESGGTAQFSVSLTSQPKGKVTIPIASSNTAEGTVNVKQLVFTASNWSTSQTFTVKGVDDARVDGDKSYQVTLGKFKGPDKGYKALAPITVNLTNIDNDVPGIKVTASNTLQTTEAGGKATFTVKLNTQPTANVVIPISSSNTAEGTVTASLTFTPSNWNQSQTVTVTGVNDAVIDGNQTYQIQFGAAVSTDPAYSGKTLDPLTVVNADNDTAGLTISPKTLTVNEGASKTVGFKLNAKPTEDVTVNLTVQTGDAQASLSVSTLTFTPDNWNVTQNVTIEGVAGDGIDGDQPFTVDVDTTSLDLLFNNLATQTVTATIHDTEAPAANYDGIYTGSYTGSVTIFGVSTPQNGDIAATVVGNTFTLTKPVQTTGTLAGDGSINFTVPTSPSNFSGVTFTGKTKDNGDGTVTVSGTWTVSKLGVHGSGTWTITRAPLTA